MTDGMQSVPKAKKQKKPRKPGRIKSWLTDPNKRARLIIWVGALVLGVFGFAAVAIGVTSTYWFCANTCHGVQDDTIIAYNRSTHNKISCMACHMPVNADPVTFMLHKVKALGELYTTITGQYELPLNPESEVAKEFEEDRCTQCHSKNRQYTYSAGIVMNHEIHEKNGVTCTTCHNRVAHVEDFKLTLAGSRKHEDWMKMEACFRCHGLAKDAKAPGKCSACHPADFELKPENHSQLGFLHPSLVNAAKSSETTVGGHPAVYEEKGAAYCYMCHDQKTFCDKCHGTPMPHSQEFETKTHGETANEKGARAKCEQCHYQSKTAFCEKCHHGTKSGWDYKAGVSWEKQHPAAIAKSGSTDQCMTCHKADFCAACHTARKIVPASHNAGNWTRPPVPTKGHPAAATQSPSSCEICHGSGGPNAKFCKSCHKVDMPHAGDYKTSHGPLVKRNKPPKAVCQNCHTQYFCDSCHHKGSSRTVPWTKAHVAIVKKSGATACFECHQETFCSACHVRAVARGLIPR
jgi:nitrate/TMAO reductase-like tetraheme cytochrome c subunit